MLPNKPPRPGLETNSPSLQRTQGGSLIAASVFAALVLRFAANEVIAGLAINFAALGLTAMLLEAIYEVRGGLTSPDLVGLPELHIPLVERVPWIGDVISGQSPLVYLSVILACVAPYLVDNTPAGMSLKVAGLRPDVAEAIGRRPTTIRWYAILASGLLVGLGGAQLATGETNQFSENMTDGRGFVAVALIFVVGRRLGLLLPASVLFAVSDVVGISLQAEGLPSQLSNVVPFAAIIVLLAATALPKRIPTLVRRRQAATGSAW